MRALPLLVLLPLLAACDDGHDHDGHDHDKGGGHVHKAPHGGTLVPLKDEVVNAEVLLDPAEGRLTAWLLDGHAENAKRIRTEKIQVAVSGPAGAAEVVVDLLPVSNSLTGEDAASTSQYSAVHASLKGLKAFQGRFVLVKDANSALEFKDVAFAYPGK